jgi:hypothetical protein
MLKIEQTEEGFSVIVPPKVQFIKRDWPDFDLIPGQNIMNKKLTGCGITEWALVCNRDIILCSPRIMLLKNKYDQHLDDVCYLVSDKESDTESDKDLEEKPKPEDFEDEDEEEEDIGAYDRMYEAVQNYIEANDGIKPIKLLVTYDSYPLLKLVLKNLGYNNRFWVVVDEFQSLLVDSRFKSDTEMKLLKALGDVENVCYVSATPMIRDYILEIPELKNLPYYTLDWEKEQPGRVKKPRLKVKSSESVFRTAKSIIEPYLAGKFEKTYKKDDKGNVITIESREAVIFVNSVNNILSIIKKTKLKPEQVNLLCANTEKNIKKIEKKLGKQWSIGKIPLRNEPHKMFTFCTRTVYLGADFYSTNARTFVISDANIENLAVDISLDLPQIVGRQRNEVNPWRDEATLYFKLLNTIKRMTKEDFEAIINQKIQDTENILRGCWKLEIDDTDSYTALVKNKISRVKFYKGDYVSVDYDQNKDPKLVFNNMVKLAERRAFEIQQIDFADRFSMFDSIDNELGLTDEYKRIKEAIKIYDNLKTFYEKLKFICKVYETDLLAYEKLLEQITDKNFREYFEILGVDRIKASGYDFDTLKKDLISASEIDKELLDKLVYDSFNVGEKYTLSSIKSTLQKIYVRVKSNQIAKATDLEDWFEVKYVLITKNKKRYHGCLILRKLNIT